jgi:hypothetical protein
VLSYTLYQINKQNKLEEFKHPYNSFWCLNIDNKELQHYRNYGIVHNNRVNYLNEFDSILSSNMIYKHINVSLQIFDFIRLNESCHTPAISHKDFDVLIVNENKDDIIIKRNENTIFFFLVLEKFFLRAYGLLERNNIKFVKQIEQLNKIENLINKDMQFGLDLKGLNAGLFDYSSALNEKKLNIVYL